MTRPTLAAASVLLAPLPLVVCGQTEHPYQGLAGVQASITSANGVVGTRPVGSAGGRHAVTLDIAPRVKGSTIPETAIAAFLGSGIPCPRPAGTINGHVPWAKRGRWSRHGHDSGVHRHGDGGNN